MRKQLHIIFIALSLTIGFVGTVVAMNETETNNKKTNVPPAILKNVNPVPVIETKIENAATFLANDDVEYFKTNNTPAISNKPSPLILSGFLITGTLFLGTVWAASTLTFLVTLAHLLLQDTFSHALIAKICKNPKIAAFWQKCGIKNYQTYADVIARWEAKAAQTKWFNWLQEHTYNTNVRALLGTEIGICIAALLVAIASGLITLPLAIVTFFFVLRFVLNVIKQARKPNIFHNL